MTDIDWGTTDTATDGTRISYAPWVTLPKALIEALSDPERPRASWQGDARVRIDRVLDHVWEIDFEGDGRVRCKLRRPADPEYASWRVAYTAWARLNPPTKQDTTVDDMVISDPRKVPTRNANLDNPDYIAYCEADRLAYEVFSWDYAKTFHMTERSALVAQIRDEPLPGLGTKSAKTNPYASIPEGVRMDYTNLATDTGRSPRTVASDMKRLVDAGTWATEDVPPASGGKPKKVFWKLPASNDQQ